MFIPNFFPWHLPGSQQLIVWGGVAFIWALAGFNIHQSQRLYRQRMHALYLVKELEKVDCFRVGHDWNTTTMHLENRPDHILTVMVKTTCTKCDEELHYSFALGVNVHGDTLQPWVRFEVD